MAYNRKTINKVKIITSPIEEVRFKKAPTFSALKYLRDYRKHGPEARQAQHNDYILSRRIDEGVSKDYRNDGILAGNKKWPIQYILVR